MKPDQIHQHLIELAEKLDIDVSEQNLRISGFPVKSGICKVKGEHRIILDKHMSIEGKIDMLLDALRSFSIDDIYIVPAIRDLLKFDLKERG